LIIKEDNSLAALFAEKAIKFNSMKNLLSSAAHQKENICKIGN
jgi:hypothetical protein